MEHSDGMYQMWRKREVQEYSGPAKDVNGEEIVLPARNSSDSDKLIQFWVAAAHAGWGFRWALVSKNTETRLVGHLGFNQLGECAEIAYHMNPEYWGNGYMYEAATKAIQWQKDQGSKQITAFVAPENHASIRLTERLGLQPTDTITDGARKYLRSL